MTEGPLNSTIGLVGRRQRVRVGGAYSKWRHVFSGVPQGSVFGPILFILYINDLPHCLKNCACKIFADDTKVYRKADTLNDFDKIQEDPKDKKDAGDVKQLAQIANSEPQAQLPILAIVMEYNTDHGLSSKGQYQEYRILWYPWKMRSGEPSFQRW